MLHVRERKKVHVEMKNTVATIAITGTSITTTVLNATTNGKLQFVLPKVTMRRRTCSNDRRMRLMLKSAGSSGT